MASKVRFFNPGATSAKVGMHGPDLVVRENTGPALNLAGIVVSLC